MNFIEAAESGLKKWITFSGRASRSEYWYYLLFYSLLIVFIHGTRVLMKPHALLAIATHNLPILLLCMAASLIKIAMLIWMIPSAISMVVRRLHDVDRSGWWYLINFTIIGAIPLLIWNCTKGTNGPNRFGPDPLANDIVE